MNEKSKFGILIFLSGLAQLIFSFESGYHFETAKPPIIIFLLTVTCICFFIFVDSIVGFIKSGGKWK